MAGIILKEHPATTLNSNWFDTGPKANKRFLSDEEIEWLFRALVDEDLTYRRGFVLLMLTAAAQRAFRGACGRGCCGCLDAASHAVEE